MRNVLILSTALLLASVPSACGQAGQTDEVPATDPQPEEPPVVEPAAALPDPMATRIADLPRSIVVDDDVIKADIRFDEAVFSFAPAIAMDVVEDARIRLDAMTADAEAYKQADPTYFRPYGLKIDWRVTGAAGALVGLEGFQYTFTGGAHGNYLTDGRIYNALTGDQLRIGLLFTDQEAAATALSGTVYKAIADAKVSRSGTSDGYQMFLGESKDAISVSDILSGNISLIASTEDGKLGGFVLHYAPYEIGSYAEGSYHVTIPQADFHEFLKPEYQSLFAGEPADVDRADD
jgi:hypothetical protein